MNIPVSTVYNERNSWYTWKGVQYSKSRGEQIESRWCGRSTNIHTIAPLHLLQKNLHLRSSELILLECILSFGGDCMSIHNASTIVTHSTPKITSYSLNSQSWIILPIFAFWLFLDIQPRKNVLYFKGFQDMLDQWSMLDQNSVIDPKCGSIKINWSALMKMPQIRSGIDRHWYIDHWSSMSWDLHYQWYLAWFLQLSWDPDVISRVFGLIVTWDVIGRPLLSHCGSFTIPLAVGQTHKKGSSNNTLFHDYSYYSLLFKRSFRNSCY